ncbi:MAG: GNAT family N-acetyltransferase [Planctomycetaceae bacterium]|nr:GNAT family N-acetyltransferase [Planctomycetaceae bacterium]
MPRLDVVVSCPVVDSFRVRQVAGLFDVPLAERSEECFTVEVPDLPSEPDWRIGLIVGPSASGKSTLARRLFPGALEPAAPWPADQAVIEALGDLPIKQATGLFTAVGFGSPPAWIRPYSVLSGGERFRCDLARALARGVESATGAGATNQLRPLVACDEFTSTVDRQVGQICSAALARGIRSGTIPCRFVAITCHYDVAEWLEPDWTIDMATQTFARRRLRRPRLELEVFRCRRDAWRLFARHHYLSGRLNPAAECYVALWKQQPVAFCATLAVMGARGRRRISRLVTLPDYQGVGIGTRLAEAIAASYLRRGLRLSLTASHPGLLAHCRRSNRWRPAQVYRTGSRPGRLRGYRGSMGRAVLTFEFVGCGGSHARLG